MRYQSLLLTSIALLLALTSYTGSDQTLRADNARLVSELVDVNNSTPATEDESTDCHLASECITQVETNPSSVILPCIVNAQFGHSSLPSIRAPPRYLV